MSAGESFYTDWVARRGDSMLLRVEGLHMHDTAGGDSLKFSFVVETREEPGQPTGLPLDSTVPASGTLELDSVGVVTGYYEAGATSGLKAEVRIRVVCAGDAVLDYGVVRIFPPVFFDNAK
jgi:hypothetical protein